MNIKRYEAEQDFIIQFLDAGATAIPCTLVYVLPRLLPKLIYAGRRVPEVVCICGAPHCSNPAPDFSIRFKRAVEE